MPYFNGRFGRDAVWILAYGPKGELVGMATVGFDERDKTHQLFNLATHPDWRGQGVAKDVLNFLTTDAFPVGTRFKGQLRKGDDVDGLLAFYGRFSENELDVQEDPDKPDRLVVRQRRGEAKREEPQEAGRPGAQDCEPQERVQQQGRPEARPDGLAVGADADAAGPHQVHQVDQQQRQQPDAGGQDQPP